MRTTEHEIAEVVVKFLKRRPKHRAPLATLIKEIPRHLRLHEDDQVQSASRPNEEAWVTCFRNIKSHQFTPGNAVFEGRLRSVPGGLALGRKG